MDRLIRTVLNKLYVVLMLTFMYAIIIIIIIMVIRHKKLRDVFAESCRRACISSHAGGGLIWLSRDQLMSWQQTG